MKLTRLLAVFVVATLFAACDQSETELPDTEADEGGLVTDDDKADSLATTATVVSMRRDERRCRFPLCGGWWVSRVNFARTKCSDGSWAAECYVGALDWTSSGLDPAVVSSAEGELQSKRVLVRGGYKRASAGEFGTYFTFNIREAYRAIGSAAASGVFYFVNDNNIRCITTPCFSMHQAKANSTIDRTLSDFNVSSIDAPPGVIEDAVAQLQSKRAIASGLTFRQRNGGLTMFATQLYTRVSNPPSNPLACASNEECGMTLFPTAVTSADDCYCPTCPVPMNSSAAANHEASWRQFCSATHGGDRCLPPPCAAPPPVACNEDRTCGFAPLN